MGMVYQYWYGTKVWLKLLNGKSVAVELPFRTLEKIFVIVSIDNFSCGEEKE